MEEQRRTAEETLGRQGQVPAKESGLDEMVHFQPSEETSPANTRISGVPP